LVKEFAIKQRFISQHYLTSVSTLPGETWKHENRAHQMLR